MSARILHLSMGPDMDESPRLPGYEHHDVYELEELELDAYRGLVISMGCDQRFLARHADKLSAWVRGGGIALVNGQPVRPFIEGMPVWRKLHFHGVEDIRLTAMDAHPIWEGVERDWLLLRTGVPGRHTFDELLEVGVGGFYARNYMTNLPESASVITGIGPYRLPVDVAYRLGGGEVIMHCGNDLDGFDTTCGPEIHMGERVAAYLGGK